MQKIKNIGQVVQDYRGSRLTASAIKEAIKLADQALINSAHILQAAG